MKKIVLLFLLVISSFINVNAQYRSTEINTINPVRYQMIALGLNEQLVFDTQTGTLQYMFNNQSYTAPLYKFYVNDKDLTNGTPTQNGRYRILIGNNEYTVIRVLDTTDGRCWKVRLSKNRDKCDFSLIEDKAYE